MRRKRLMQAVRDKAVAEMARVSAKHVVCTEPFLDFNQSTLQKHYRDARGYLNLSKLKLQEIGDWVEKQRKLYDDYFQELWKVKVALSYYHRVREIIARQLQIVKEYKDAWALFQQDKNFTKEELESMFGTYAGMMEESVKNIDQLVMVANAFSTQMSDAARLEIINSVSDNIEKTLMDLKQFNEQAKMVSLQRAAEKGEIDYVRKLYGL